MAKRLKMWRVSADYRTFANRVFAYTVFGVSKADAKDRWNKRLPWLKILDIKQATSEEEKEYSEDMGEFYEWTKERPLVWMPKNEKV